jgi:acyl carrier protein phosphodiesterase
MNWLAHFLLAEPAPAFRVGSVLPDFAPATLLASLPPAFQPGIAQHRQVDLFADTHPVFLRSRRRFPPRFRRFAGILTDVFYDHLLARNWASYAEPALPAFAAEVYAAIEACRPDLPPETYGRLARLRQADLLCAYGELAGVERALRGLGSRLRRPADLAAALPVFAGQHCAFDADFGEFFPALRAPVGVQPLAPSRLSSSALRSTPHL